MCAISYRLRIRLARDAWIRVGALGRFRFPAGDYLYTGSARRNLEARIARHASRDKKPRWHIDYLLLHPAATLVAVERSSLPECEWHRTAPGAAIVPGFGASDCRAGCGSHLHLIARRPPPSP